MARLPRSGLLPMVLSARQFGELHPGVAGFLARTSTDPFLERMREGISTSPAR